MKRILFLLWICLCDNMLHAEFLALDSLRLTENFLLKQKVILHNIKTTNTINDSTTVYEFVHKGFLYIISSAFTQDYHEYMQEFPDVPSLVEKIMSTCHTECADGDCGYSFSYDSNLPSTLTVFTYPNMDTVQYLTTHSPVLHVAIIRDTLFGSIHIRCGVSLKEMFRKLSIEPLYYYNYLMYKKIVLIPTEFSNRTCVEKSIILPTSCIVIEHSGGIISQIEIRQIDFFSDKGILKDAILY